MLLADLAGLSSSSPLSHEIINLFNIMPDRIRTISIHPRHPASPVSFRIIISIINPYPAMPRKSIRCMISGSRGANSLSRYIIVLCGIFTCPHMQLLSITESLSGRDRIRAVFYRAGTDESGRKQYRTDNPCKREDHLQRTSET